MSDFKITEILSQSEFTTEHGAFVGYEVRFEGDQGNGVAQHNRKAASAAPKVGEVIDAELVHKGERVTLKRIWKQDGGGGRSNGGGSKGYDDPKTIARITRSHCQKVAVELLGIEAQIAVAQDNENSQKFFSTLREPSGVSKALEARIAFFEKNVQESAP